MAFSSLSIEQLTFDADDKRCKKQSVDSFESLVNYDSEFPQRESFAFKDLLFGKNKRNNNKKKKKSPIIDFSSNSDDDDDDEEKEEEIKVEKNSLILTINDKNDICNNNSKSECY
jgi:hypothetical protein